MPLKALAAVHRVSWQNQDKEDSTFLSLWEHTMCLHPLHQPEIGESARFGHKVTILAAHQNICMQPMIIGENITDGGQLLNQSWPQSRNNHSWLWCSLLTVVFKIKYHNFLTKLLLVNICLFVYWTMNSFQGWNDSAYNNNNNNNNNNNKIIIIFLQCSSFLQSPHGGKLTEVCWNWAKNNS